MHSKRNTFAIFLALAASAALSFPVLAQAPSSLAVQGSVGEGVTSTKPPVLEGLKDANGKVRSAEGTTYGEQVLTSDSRKAAIYRVGGTFTPVGTADRTLITMQGSATKTVRVKRVLIGGTSTASGTTAGLLSRTTALGTGGTAVTPTIAKTDTSSASATAVVKHYTTAAQSLGATPTTLGFFGVSTVVATAASNPVIVFPENGSPLNEAIVLRGVADFLEIGNNAGNVTAGAVLWYTIEFEEE